MPFSSAELKIVESADEQTVTVTTSCPSCKAEVVVKDIPAKPFSDWYYAGQPIQLALRALKPMQRETLLTGFCPECFDDLTDDVAEEVA